MGGSWKLGYVFAYESLLNDRNVCVCVILWQCAANVTATVHLLLILIPFAHATDGGRCSLGGSWG